MPRTCLVIDRGVEDDFKGGAMGVVINHLAMNLHLAQGVSGIRSLPNDRAILEGEGYGLFVAPTENGMGYEIRIHADTEDALEGAVKMVRMAANLVYNMTAKEVSAEKAQAAPNMG